MPKFDAITDDVRLETVQIVGYRSCAQTTFSPEKDLSVLIGINGAGKTNILQGIRLLETRRNLQGGRVTEDLSRSPKAKVVAWFRVGKHRVGLRVRFNLVNSTRRGEERVSVSEEWNLYSFTKSRVWRNLPPFEFTTYGDRFKEFYTRYKKAPDFPSFLLAVGNQKVYEDIINNKMLTKSLFKINEFRQGIAYYSASQFTDPTKCPSSFEVDEDGRLSDIYNVKGSIHIKFLHDLFRLRGNNRPLYDSYSNFVSKKQLGLIGRITWKEIELSSYTVEVKSGGRFNKIRKKKTLVIPKLQVGNAHITFNQLSEGTFKTLALVFYIFTDSSTLLMVEEPEVCVHHGLLSRVVATLQSHSSQKQIVISTHSDQLVDVVNPQNLFVVEMGRDGTEVNNLNRWLDGNSRHALHEYLAESGTLGEYWRSGGLS